MESLIFPVEPGFLLAAMAIALAAGVVKGMVGFAMPMILISGLGSFVAPELALAGLILPTVLTNLVQALRQGPAAALRSVRRFGLFLGVGFVALLISAQFVRLLPADVMLLLIGGPVALFALIQLFGLRVRLAARSRPIEIGLGAVAGLIGGMSGVWGPPTVLYLTALDTEKTEQIRVQGVIYALGALALLAAHLGSGVLRAETWPFSAALVPPALAGMWLGARVQDRIDQATFRRATLLVLTFAALNLVRRGLGG
ncbi:sulfite exporter TauE/SafE family protein [Shimia sp.]|uniref:sulfite exporter TauE/SafE family protein n=1 Tax=Shimia sp. TaxID=1954381 RepID=UPI003566680B